MKQVTKLAILSTLFLIVLISCKNETPGIVQSLLNYEPDRLLAKFRIEAWLGRYAGPVFGVRTIK